MAKAALSTLPLRRTGFCLSSLVMAALMASTPAFAQARIVPLKTTSQTTAIDKVSAEDIALVNRLTWGVSPSTLQDFAAMGREAWLKAQLHPQPGDHLPDEVSAQIKALPKPALAPEALVQEFQTLRNAATAAAKAAQTSQSAPVMADGLAMTAAPAALVSSTLPTPHRVSSAYRHDALNQAQARHILRALYSKNQLLEQMIWFWLNHFNIYANKSDTQLFVADYEEKALRAHALGSFRALLEATLRHPAMLHYLDNTQNSLGHGNENYAREIMELHTMGVGSGYTQRDVQELARIFTGLTVATPGQVIKLPPAQQQLLQREGMFLFLPSKHDFGDKVFLGQTIKGTGYDEVSQALDSLANHPATAHYISLKLAKYFVADQPPESLVAAMAKRFSETRGNITSVLDEMIRAPAFRASLKQPLLKDPQHFILSALRLGYDGRLILNVKPAINWISQLGQPLYGRPTPDGYPLDRTAWNGPGQIEQRFEIAKQIASGVAALLRPEGSSLPVADAAPFLHGPFFDTVLGKTLLPGTKVALAQAKSPREWATYFLSSPDFMGR